eukprot:g4783.t1
MFGFWRQIPWHERVYLSILRFLWQLDSEFICRTGFILLAVFVFLLFCYRTCNSGDSGRGGRNDRRGLGDGGGPSGGSDGPSQATVGARRGTTRRRTTQMTPQAPQPQQPLRRSARIAALNSRTSTSQTQQRADWKLRAKLRPFDGVTEDPLQWCRHAQRVFELSAITDEALQVSLALSAFTSSAQVWSDSSLSSDVVDWDTFEEQLLHRFRPSGFDNKLQQLIHALSQQRAENVSQYSDRYLELCNLSNSSPDTYSQGWIEGLLPSIKRFVLFEAPSDFDSALDAAHRAEAATEGDRTLTLKTGPRTRQPGNTSGATPWVQSRHAVSNQPGAFALRRNEPIPAPPRHQNQAQSSRHCWLCGKEGHFQKDCPHRAQLEQRPQQLLARSYTATFPVADDPVFAECFVNGIPVSSVILDPGSTHTFIDTDFAEELGCHVIQPGPVIRGINGLVDKATGVTDIALQIQIGSTSVSVWPIVVNSRQQYRLLLGMDFLTRSKAEADFSRNLYIIGGLQIRQQQDRLELIESTEPTHGSSLFSFGDAVLTRGDEESFTASTTTPIPNVTGGSRVETDQGTEYHSLQPSSSTTQDTHYEDCLSTVTVSNDSNSEIWFDALPIVPTEDVAISAFDSQSHSSDPTFQSAVSFPMDAQPQRNPGRISQAIEAVHDDSSGNTDYASAPENSSTDYQSVEGVPVVGNIPRAARANSTSSDDYETATVGSVADPEEPENTSESTLVITDPPSSDHLDPELSNTSPEPSLTSVTSAQPSDPTFSSTVSEIFVSSSTSSNDVVPAFRASLAEPEIQCYFSENESHSLRSRLPSEPKDFLSEVDINPNLSRYQRSRLQSVLRENAELFSTDILTFPVCPVLQHEIILKPGARPFRVPKLKRFSKAERTFIDSEISRLLQAGFIKEHDGSWCAPITVVPKKTGSYRLCVAFCGLNQRTERQNHPLPYIQDLIDSAAGSKYYTSLDAQSAFHSLELTEASQPLTGFTTGAACYCFLRMPFGLTNAPMSFARAIRTVLQPVESRKCVACYMDDCLVYSDSFEQHLEDISATLTALHKGGLRLNVGKCHFGYGTVSFLGHVLSEQGVQTDPQKTEAIAHWREPENASDIRRFLGLCNFYRDHIHRYSEISEPLLLLTRKHQSSFHWGPEQDEAFRSLKTALTEAPVLASPDFTKEFVLECDASEVAIASILSQDKPIGYYSKTLSTTERKYSVTDKEMLSVVASFIHFRPYLHGSFTRCYTDHSSVVKLCRSTQNSGRKGRWADLLQEFDFSIEHQAGSANKKADALSRSLGPDPVANPVNSENSVGHIVARFSSVDEDPFLRDIKHYLVTGETRGNTSRQRKQVRDRSIKFSLREDQLLYMDVDGALKICVPQQDTQSLIAEYHNANHWGRDLTLTAIRQIYWWRSMYRDISEFIKKCEVCQSFGASHRTAPLQPVLTIQPLEILEMDFAGPVSNSETSYLVSATCCLTRWIECRSVSSPSTANAIQFLQEQVFYRFGLPICILTDRAQAFADRFTGFLQRFNIQHRRSSAEHPQTLGNEERSHGLVLQKVRQFLVENPSLAWEQHLPRAVFAVNSRVSVSAPISPLEAMIGVTPRRPTELRLLAKVQPTVDRIRAVSRAGKDIDYLTSRLMKLGSLQDECAILKEERARTMKDRYDRAHRTKPPDFQVDDLVWIKRVGRIGKLQPRWRGPGVIVHRNEDVYTVQLGEQDIVCHANRLKPYDFHRQ